MSWSAGDFVGDGTVDINDLTIVLANFDKSAAAAGIEAVPEPSTVALIGAGAIGLLGLVGRPRKHAS
jgi:threonine dehydrogenase-like Zn-dependent dehydrogenase